MAGGDSAGGSRELARLIDGAGEELAFDLRHYLGIDLLDVLRPGSGLTPSLVLMYVRQLPLDSATVAYLRGGPEFRGWDQDRYMQADTIDLLQWLGYLFISANSKKRPKKPTPFERPDDKHKKKNNPNSFRAMAAARISAMKKRKQPNG